MGNSTTRKVIDMVRGVYTVSCHGCGQHTYVHVEEDGDFDPWRCTSCKKGFLSIEKGEGNNEYLSIPLTEEGGTEEKETEEAPKAPAKEVKKTKVATKKTGGSKSKPKFF